MRSLSPWEVYSMRTDVPPVTLPVVHIPRQRELDRLRRRLEKYSTAWHHFVAPLDEVRVHGPLGSCSVAEVHFLSWDLLFDRLRVTDYRHIEARLRLCPVPNSDGRSRSLRRQSGPTPRPSCATRVRRTARTRSTLCPPSKRTMS